MTHPNVELGGPNPLLYLFTLFNIIVALQQASHRRTGKKKKISVLTNELPLAMKTHMNI